MTILAGTDRQPKRSPFVPPGLVEAFSDDFDGPLSIEDGLAPTTGATWSDAFSQFGVRNLVGNQDLCHKGRPALAGTDGTTFSDIGAETLIQRGSTLLMSAFNIPTANRPAFNSLPFAGPMLDSRRSCNFSYGYVEWRFRAHSLGAGTHWSLWLWASDDNVNGLELDAVELIGSNQAAPEGPVNLMAYNSHDNRAGSTHSTDHPITFVSRSQTEMHDWHVYGIEIDQTTITWTTDGVQTRTIPNGYPANQPWHILVTLEMGASPNGDFPGAVRPSTPFPNSAELDYVRVYTSDGSLVPPPALP